MDGGHLRAQVNRSWSTLFWRKGGRAVQVGDVLVLAVFIALNVAVAGWVGAAIGDPVAIEVEVDGRRVLTLDPDSPGFSNVEGVLGTTRIEVRDRRVRVVSSPCPLGLCRQGGWIEGGGRMIVCLPNRVVVRIRGGNEEGPDAVSR